MEIDSPITDSAEHSNRIKEICRQHCGYAAPMLAEYIINQGGINYVMPIYKAWLEKLRNEMPESVNKDRFVEKFAALFMATADIATEALNINFDKDGILQFLFEYNQKNANKRNVALQSYDKIIEECRNNINSVHHPNYPQPRGKVYGRFCIPKNKHIYGKKISEEILVRGSYVEEILKKYKFPNIDTCAKAWTDAQVISRDIDRFTRTRQVEPTSNDKEDVYVFLTFKNEDNTEGGEDNDHTTNN